MSYRELIKVTNRYVKNEKFKDYLREFYRINKHSNINAETVKAWITLLAFLSDNKPQNKPLQEKLNLRTLFVKDYTWSLSQ